MPAAAQHASSICCGKAQPGDSSHDSTARASSVQPANMTSTSGFQPGFDSTRTPGAYLKAGAVDALVVRLDTHEINGLLGQPHQDQHAHDDGVAPEELGQLLRIARRRHRVGVGRPTCQVPDSGAVPAAPLTCRKIQATGKLAANSSSITSSGCGAADETMPRLQAGLLWLDCCRADSRWTGADPGTR
jgi:hypothetical protein